MAYDPASSVIAEIEQRRFDTGISWQQVGRAHRQAAGMDGGGAAGQATRCPPGKPPRPANCWTSSPETVAALQRQPYRTADPALQTDLTIYRFVELINVYGPAFKALIHEEFGDGIMSAINCNVPSSGARIPEETASS